MSENMSRVNRKSDMANRLRFLFLFCMLFIMIIPITSIPVDADGGLIPFHNFSVYEPGQKAIIAWDGETEILILSVDVLSTSETKALHMVPFPSIPEIELGNTSSFRTVQWLLNSKTAKRWSTMDNSLEYDAGGYGNVSVEIVFHEITGPHDITITCVSSSENLTEWVTSFLTDKGLENINLPENLDEVVDSYLLEDIRYFAFDVIDIGPKQSSVDPLVYTFDSDCLYFPLKISSIIEGDSQISLALIAPTDMRIDWSPMGDIGYSSHIGVQINNSEMLDVSPKIAELIEDEANLIYYKQWFHLKNLDKDIELVGKDRGSILSADMKYYPLDIIPGILILAVLMTLVYVTKLFRS